MQRYVLASNRTLRDPLVDNNNSVESGAIGVLALFEGILVAMHTLFDLGTLRVGCFKSLDLGYSIFADLRTCRMCSATIYWAHIGRIVYAATNDQLAELTGPGNKENFTMK